MPIPADYPKDEAFYTVSSEAVLIFLKKEEFKMAKMLFTSESVTEGRSDKVCDGISAAIRDEILKTDPGARVAF